MCVNSSLYKDEQSKYPPALQTQGWSPFVVNGPGIEPWSERPSEKK